MAPSASDNPVRRCSPCNVDWPNTKRFATCPKCLEETWSSTAETIPDHHAAKQLADKYDAFHTFLETGQDPHAKTNMAAFETAFAACPSIPDPVGGKTNPPPRPPTEEELQRWEGDDA